MHVMLRLSFLSGALLLPGVPFALAESPLPDPIAPAVVGRPLDEIRPAPALQKQREPSKAQKRAAAKPSPRATAKAGTAAKPAQPSQAARAAAAAAVMGAAPAASPATQRAEKQALDDRADPRMQVSEVGKGRNLARKPLAPGAYFNDRHRMAVRKFYQQHAGAGEGADWKIGEPVPQGAPLAPVPKGLLSSLPKLPPGHQYVQLGGEVVLIAAGSRMVVDGISRTP